MERSASIVSFLWHTTACVICWNVDILGKIKAGDIEKAPQAVVQLIQSAVWFPYRR